MPNDLAGKAIDYLIGADSAGTGNPDRVTMAPYGKRPALRGISIGYCNLFDELNTGALGPYLHSSDTARDYDEGQIDPHGPGWAKNLNAQFVHCRRQGFQYIELDNPDSYDIADVIGAIDLANKYSLKVIAKNPELMEAGEDQYLRHPNVYGAIVEKDCGGAQHMNVARRIVGKPDLPVWFVSFGNGRLWARSVASTVKVHDFHNMGVTYSTHGEYESSEDILVPHG